MNSIDRKIQDSEYRNKLDGVEGLWSEWSIINRYNSKDYEQQKILHKSSNWRFYVVFVFFQSFTYFSLIFLKQELLSFDRWDTAHDSRPGRFKCLNSKWCENPIQMVIATLSETESVCFRQSYLTLLCITDGCFLLLSFPEEGIFWLLLWV